MNERSVMNKILQWRKQRSRCSLTHFTYTTGIVALCCLAVLLSACTAVSLSNPFAVPAKSGNGTVTITPTTASETSVSPTPTPVPPVITLQLVNCPSTTKINWDALVGTRTQVNKVQKVICGSLEGYGSLQALVNVRYYSPDARLDFYVYTNLYGTPVQQFKVLGLLDGDAQISPTGTVITAEIGPNGLGSAAPNVFKEFQWNGSSFGQISFPGIYPDMTHYQAEQTQSTVNSGYGASKDTTYPAVTGFASHVLRWAQITNKTITYDSRHGIYIVECQNIGPGGGGFYANLFRLDNNPTNIFEISQITPLDSNIKLSSPLPGTQVSSPAKISGTSLATGKVLGQSILYDDKYTIVGNSGAINSTVSSGYTSFSSSVPFKLSNPGLQEGVIIFYSTNQNNIEFTNQVVVVKVFFTG